MYVERVSITEKAKAVIDRLREQHGDLMFHQSGGCCDGSSPMCFAKGEFLIGSRDLYLGEIHGCSFYMASDQFEYYKNMHIKVDVSEGRGSSFSLEIPLGLRFMAISRLLTDDERGKLRPIVVNPAGRVSGPEDRLTSARSAEEDGPAGSGAPPRKSRPSDRTSRSPA